jgi:hypothetical protein
MIEVNPLQIERLVELDGIVPARSSRTGIRDSSQQTTFRHWRLILAVALIATHVMWAPALLWGHSGWFAGPTLGQAAVFEIDHVIASGHVTGNDRHLS